MHPPQNSIRRRARWTLPPGDEAAVGRLQRELGLQPPAARVLARRGFEDPAAARIFLCPDLTGLHNPLLMRDADRAVARIEQAIRNGERILIYGDYDVDGTTSIVILKSALEVLGASAAWRVPHRLKDGYGMQSDAIEQAAKEGVRLIVSVDTGIRAAAEIKRAAALGVDVIVTDHHVPEADLPAAWAVLNPNRPDCEYPEKNLCGAGVVFKLIQALFDRAVSRPGAGAMTEGRRQALLDSYLKLVAMATVADIVPLTGENRVIVRRGLSGFGVIRNAGLRALLEVAGFAPGERPSAGQVAFRLAPRINAAGRMASANDVIELFTTQDPARAQALAQQLDALNRERQREENETVEQILAQLDLETYDASWPALVFAQAGWHLGVAGIVASRMVERLSRPVFVLSSGQREGEWSGSGRSVPAFHLLEALESMSGLFLRFGGHRQAAGVTLTGSNLEVFRARFREYAEARLQPADLCPQIKVDANADFTELTEAAVAEVFSLAPFGMGNPAPRFHAAGVEVAAPPKPLGNGKHLKVALRQNGRTLMFKAWRWGEHAEVFQRGQILDVVFEVEEDSYARRQGYGTWSASLDDARLHGE
jgi:single-stranded-DNA-specific exonuclease